MQSNIVIKYNPYPVRAFIVITIFITSVASAVTQPVKMLRACIDYDNDVVTISWSPPSDACSSFEKHIIYGSENMGPFQKLAEIANISVSEFPHALGVQNTSWRYYLTTYSECGGVDSLGSDTIAIDITYPLNIELDSISYNIETQDIVAGWKANPSKDTKHYEIFDYSSGSGDLLGKTEQLNFNVTEQRNGRFPVVLATLDSCNLSSLLSNPHETTHLSGTIDSCLNTVSLEWNLYVGWGDVDSQALFLSLNKHKFVRVSSFGGDVTAVQFNDFVLGDTMTFFIRSYKDDKSTSSNIKTFKTRKLAVPQNLDLRLVDVENNTLIIRWLCEKQGDTKEFNLYGSQNHSSFNKIKTISAVLGNEKYTYIDSKNNPSDQSFLYYVSCTDKCNNQSLTSDTSASLFLDTSNATIHNKYIGWENGVLTYSVEEKNGFTWNTVKENISGFETNDIQSFVGCFRIAASERNSKDGDNIAHSNVVCKRVPLKYYITTGLNPDGINNRFVVKGESIDTQKSLFYIYSRWGELIKKGTLNQGWNGKYQGKNVQPGAYIYLVKVYGLNGEYEQSKGVVNVVN